MRCHSVKTAFTSFRELGGFEDNGTAKFAFNFWELFVYTALPECLTKGCKSSQVQYFITKESILVIFFTSSSG